MSTQKFKTGVMVGTTFVFLIIVLYVWNSYHGFFFDSGEYDQVPPESIRLYTLTEKNAYRHTFVPSEDKFVGFALNLTGLSQCDPGKLNLRIYDAGEKIIDSISIDISKMQDKSWYPVQIGESLHKGQPYVLQIENIGCTVPPILQIIDNSLSSEKSELGNLLIGYAYSRAVFSDSERILISIAAVAAFVAVMGWGLTAVRWKSWLTRISIFLVLTLGLAWNYTFNFMDSSNTLFSTFQSDSEALVTGVIQAEYIGIDTLSSRLGRYQDASGSLYGATVNEFVTDGNWDHGYSRTSPMLAIDYIPYTEEVCREGNYVRFANGEIFQILHIFQNGNYLNLQLDAQSVLTKFVYGDLHDLEFLNEQGEALPKGKLYPYLSQFGLQGQVFRWMAKRSDHPTDISDLNLLCSLNTAGVLCLICFLLYRKYNGLLAGCFYVTFLLSPWIVNFARNLYWVEFTWFLPMVVGLLCAIKIDRKRWRILSYIAGWAAIFVKCLCGYEYLTSIMLGMIIFLLADWFEALKHHERQNAKRLFFTVFSLGISAILGFICALCIHAHMVGNGDIGAGIITILERTILLRTNGGSLENFGAEYWPSLNASIWEVLKTYFQFSTQLLTGIQGNLFPMLAISPVVCFFYNATFRRQEWKDVSLYILSFVTSISWLVLAKSHSYIHTHMNYVLWYFGFVQICIYILCKQLIIIKNSISNKKGTEIKKRK